MDAAKRPFAISAVVSADQRQATISPYIALLTQMRESSNTVEDRHRIDVLTIAVAKMSSSELYRSERVVDYCESNAISVSEYI